MKNIVVLLGPGASGKSTLMQKLIGAPWRDDKVTITSPTSSIEVKCCFGDLAKIAVPGTHKNGSDSISKMEDRAELVTCLTRDRYYQTIILDGVRSSIKWDVDWLRELRPKPRIIYVYFDLTVQENEQRLLERRRKNGAVADKLPPKTYENMMAFRSRALRVWQAARLERTALHIQLTTETPDQAAARVQKELR